MVAIVIRNLFIYLTPSCLWVSLTVYLDTVVTILCWTDARAGWQTRRSARFDLREHIQHAPPMFRKWQIGHPLRFKHQRYAFGRDAVNAYAYLATMLKRPLARTGADCGI